VSRSDDAARRADARARRRAATPPPAGHTDDDAGEPDSGNGHGETALHAARAAAAAAALGAAVGAARALVERDRDDEEPADEVPSDDASAEDEHEPPEDAQDEAEPEHAEPEHAEADHAEIARRRETARRTPRGAPASRTRSVVEAARGQLRDLAGAEAESVTALERAGEGWRVTLEVVEVRRVPDSTDVLATYVVDLDGDADLVRYERLRRYYRAQADLGDAR